MYRNKPEEVRDLLSKETIPQNFLNRALLLASSLEKTHIEIVKSLLEAKADPNCQDLVEWTPLHIAVCFPNRSDLVEALLEANADPNSREIREQTPLHVAAKKGNAAAIHLLLEAGAKTSCKDERGNLPFSSFSEVLHRSFMPEVLEVKKSD